jgi:hypothetical protein
MAWNLNRGIWRIGFPEAHNTSWHSSGNVKLPLLKFQIVISFGWELRVQTPGKSFSSCIMCTPPSTQIIVLFFTVLPLWRSCEHIKQVGNIIYKSSKMSKIKIGGLLQAIERRTWIIRHIKISSELYLKNSWWINPSFF